MTQDRLTRQEISWLLAQEARGAARALREGLSQPPPALDTHAAPVESGPVVSGLDTLTGAMSLLSDLQTGSTSGRRGRIDLASLLYDLAPHARIAIEPGGGTEVFGDEDELRRMLHLLVTQSVGEITIGTAAPEIRIERDGEFVRVGVELGPDSSANADLERRWLSRMAVHHGGRLELARGRQTIVLPADGATERREVEELRKELVEAQQLGEAYARELASVFNEARERQSSLPHPRSLGDSESFDRVAMLARASGRKLREWLEELRQDIDSATQVLEGEAAEALTKRLTGGAELLADLTSLGECPTTEQPVAVKLSELAERIAGGLDARAARRGVRIEVEASDTASAVIARGAVGTLLRALLVNAIASTPAGDAVRATLEMESARLSIVVSDGGPAVATSSLQALLEQRSDPQTMGRGGGPSLVTAHTVVTRLGGRLGVRTGADGRTEFWAEIPTSAPAL